MSINKFKTTTIIIIVNICFLALSGYAQKDFTSVWKNEVQTAYQQFDNYSFQLYTQSTIRGKHVEEEIIDTTYIYGDSTWVYVEQKKDSITFLGVENPNFISFSTEDTNTIIHFRRNWIGINALKSNEGNYIHHAYLLPPFHFFSDIVGKGKYWTKIDTIYNIIAENKPYIVFQWVDSNTALNDIQMIEDVYAYVNPQTHLIQKIQTKRRNNTLVELTLGAIEREIIFDYQNFNYDATADKERFIVDFRYDQLLIVRNGFPWLQTEERKRKDKEWDNLIADWTKQEIALPKEILETSLVGFDNREIQLNQYEGWVLVDMWFKSCMPCFDFMKVVNKHYNELQKRGITLVSLNPTKEKPDEQMRAYCEKQGVMLDKLFFSINLDKNIQRTFNIFPAIYLVNPQKKVIYKKHGFSGEEDFWTMLKEIDTFLKE